MGANTKLRELKDQLGGSVGLTTFPAAAAAGDGVSIAEVLRYIQELGLSSPLCCEKLDGAILSGTDPLFTISGGPIKLIEITGIVTTLIVGAANAKLTYTTVAPAATVDMSAGAVAIDDDAAGTSYQTINTTGIFTPVTAGIVKEANAFATKPTQFLLPPGSLGLNCTAARVGVIAWYLRYVPLSPNSRVVAAA
jgi:hypothetical protein